MPDAPARGLRAVFDEAHFAPPAGATSTYFADFTPDSGLCGVLDALDAAIASRSPGPGRKTVVGHARHALVYVDALVATLRGEKHDADWDHSFDPPAANDAEWAELRARLRASCEALAALADKLDVGQQEKVSRVAGAIAHAAYHLGAVKQILQDVRAK